MRTWREENYKFYLHRTCLLCTLRLGTQALLSEDAPALAKLAAAASFDLIFLKAYSPKLIKKIKRIEKLTDRYDPMFPRNLLCFRSNEKCRSNVISHQREKDSRYVNPVEIDVR